MTSTRPPEDRYCQKCGARPDEPCRTSSGRRAKTHVDRGNGALVKDNHAAVRLRCWRKGWRAGAALMSIAQSHELASVCRAPRDFLDGWREACNVTERETEKARQRLMA